MRLSNKDVEQEYVEGRLESSLKTLYGRYWDAIKQTEVPLSRMINDTLKLDIYNVIIKQIRLIANPWPKYRTWIFIKLREVSLWHLQQCNMLTGASHSSRHLVPSRFGIACALLVETNTSPSLSKCSGLCDSNNPMYFLYLRHKLFVI